MLSMEMRPNALLTRWTSMVMLAVVGERLRDILGRAGELLQKINPDYKDRILYMLDVMLKDAQNNTLQDKLA